MIRTIACQRCGKEVQTTAPVQKYCRECSEVRDLDRKKIWARGHPKPADVEQRARSKSIRSEIQNGARNAAKPEDLAYMGDRAEPDLHTIIRIAVPFSYGLSKNAIYTMRPNGHVILREQTKALRNEIVLRLREALAGRTQFFQAKVYLDILVEKPDHKGDAVNVLDTVCDAVKEAIGVDDRWYAIRSLDWRIVKDGGRLILGVGQEATEDQRSCHRCGRIFPLSSFSGIKSKARVCSECRRQTKEGTA